ncbi:MAG: energy transducer TonB [Gammaproteobacteria bacterium]|nr:energy transducer TonB [Gammaproteobacteria bacterium]
MSATINQLPRRYSINYSDRLGVMLFFALALHAVVILGVSFNLEDMSDPKQLDTMEITLVHSQSDDTPQDADYLAQANQLGSGNTEEKVRASSPFSNPLPTPDKGFAPHTREDITPPKADKEKYQRETLTVNKSRQQTYSKPEKIPLPHETNKVTAAQLYERSSEIARLSAEINHLKKAFAKEPHHTYVSGANAKKYEYASYLDAWRAKVEKIGNMNYPSKALEKRLTGSLLLDVAIKPDGSLYSVKVLRSSGHPMLDRAAKRIVRMASPFAPLPKEIRKQTDILHIPRVWQFRNEAGLFTSGG